MKLIFRWVINSIAMLLIAYIVPGFEVETFYVALLAALVLGLINALIRPLLLILTLPINIITLGLFTFVLNALMLWLASTIVSGFIIDGFLTALVGAIILWAVSVLTGHLLKAAERS